MQSFTKLPKTGGKISRLSLLDLTTATSCGTQQKNWYSEEF